MSDNITPEQWEQVRQLRDQWLENTTNQQTLDDVKATVADMYSAMNREAPSVLLAPSPLAMVRWSSAVNTLLCAIRDDGIADKINPCVAKIGEQPEESLLWFFQQGVGEKIFGANDNEALHLVIYLIERSIAASQADCHYVAGQLMNSEPPKDGKRKAKKWSKEEGIRLVMEVAECTKKDAAKLVSIANSYISTAAKAMREQPWYVGQYWRAWGGFYRAGELLGTKYDKERLDRFVNWGEIANTWCAYDLMCVVSRNPTRAKWEGDDLHSEDGMAVQYPDGWGLWAIGGVVVDEQIVMRPDSQTIEQINSEENEEVKRIRITRYGWGEYLTKIDAEVLDTRHGEWVETLLKSRLDGITVLCTYDPSTGRPYSLEVDPNCKTCEEAQAYLLAPNEALEGTGLSAKQVYPVVRT